MNTTPLEFRTQIQDTDITPLRPQQLQQLRQQFYNQEWTEAQFNDQLHTIPCRWHILLHTTHHQINTKIPLN